MSEYKLAARNIHTHLKIFFLLLILPRRRLNCLGKLKHIHAAAFCFLSARALDNWRPVDTSLMKSAWRDRLAYRVRPKAPHFVFV
jgi:hypothetical protein